MKEASPVQTSVGKARYGSDDPEPARLLLVDDHLPNLVALEAVLLPLGHPLVVATSGEEALRRLLADDYALVLLDVQMPGMNGLETASLIRSHSRMRAIPIIFMTAIDGSPARAFEGYAAGAVDYIVKPVEPEILRSKVAAFVAIHVRNEDQKARARAEREKQIAALQRSNEDRYRSLVEAVPLPIWSSLRDGSPSSANRAWIEYTGCAPDDLASFSTPGLVHDDDVERMQSDWQGALARAQPFEAEVRLRHAADGEYRWHLVRALPERRASGQSSGFIVSATDIEETKRAEAQKAALLLQEQRAREAAEEHNRSKDEFLATISHELRTPLNAILGWAELVQSGELDEKATARALETIVRNAHSQARLISDLLEVSRIESGKVRVDPRPIDLDAALRSSLDSLRPAAVARDVSLVVETAPGTSEPVVVDSQRFQQVVGNLITNAIKFGAKNVKVTLTRTRREAVLRVDDDGQGIAPEFLSKVFDRFQQADTRSTRQHGGLGLGLSIVAHIARLHGGSVSATSDGVGKGATFEVRFPATQSGVYPRPPEIELERRPIAPSLAGMDVLVVDDEEEALELMRAILGKCGATIRVASSVAGAVAEVTHATPDLVITDIGMPGEDGYSLLRHIRDLGRSGRVAPPAIALTAYASADDRARLLEAGFLAHLTKPLSSSELFSTLRRVLRLEA